MQSDCRETLLLPALDGVGQGKAGCCSIVLIFQTTLQPCVCVWFHIRAQDYFWASGHLRGTDMLFTVNSLALLYCMWPFQLLTMKHAVSLN